MIGNILDNTTELYMVKYTFGEIFSSGGATLYKNPSDQTVHSFNSPMDLASPISKIGYRQNAHLLHKNTILSK